MSYEKTENLTCAQVRFSLINNVQLTLTINNN